MKLAFITDEATQSFSEAVEFAKKNGFSGVELRSIEDRPIDQIPREKLREWKAILDKEQLEVACVSSSFNKCFADDEAKRSEELEKLVRLCNAADDLGCDKIRGFAFFRPESGCICAEELAPLFTEAANILRWRKKKLLLEADPTVNTTNHSALAKLLNYLDRDVFGAVYDPGNDLYDPWREKPYPDGYQAIRSYCLHVHVKDVVYGPKGEPRCVAPGKGLVGWTDILKQLICEGYDGWLSLETHYRKNAVLTEQQMRVPQGCNFTLGGLGATEESAQALREILTSIKTDCK